MSGRTSQADMWLKCLVATFFLLSILGAFLTAPQQRLSRNSSTRDISDISDDEDRVPGGRRLRLMSWNIGNGDLESDTRAHSQDLPAVAKVIKDNDVDAVAIQELTDEDQLKVLLSHLESRYRGYVCGSGGADRVDAVLIKNGSGGKDRGDRRESGPKNNRGVRFNNVPAATTFAAAATFRLHSDLPEIVLVSAHADAFSASRRRTFAADVVDWANRRPKGEIVFIAGDFNFEVSIRNKTNLFTDDATHDSESYAYLLRYFRDLGRDAGETSINDRRIDYIFGPLETVSLRRAEVLRGAVVGRMDHWPLLVEVALLSS
ncbi:MAG: endonuclease/exonuclease/phosphatase family protein [Acidobacteriota bacterium]|nr:endonuclease/exonuclease/phosphatase family protein [Acidobacteriota bacterium]